MSKSDEETLHRLERELDKILQENETYPLFIKEDGTPMEFCMDIAREKNMADLLLKFKKLVRAFGGSLKFNLSTGSLYVIKFVHLPTFNAYFISTYLIDCAKQKKILDLNLYRASPCTYDDHINVMNIMKGINSWEDAAKMPKHVAEKSEEVSDFSGEEEEYIYNEPKFKMKVSRRGYTFAEEKAILNYIIQSKLFYKVKGNDIWKRMEAKEVCCSRTWQSMKEHYMKYIIPKLNQFKLDSHVKAKLKMCFQSNETKMFHSKQNKTSQNSSPIEVQPTKDVHSSVISSGENKHSDSDEYSSDCPNINEALTPNKYGSKTTRTNRKSSPLKKSALSHKNVLGHQEENSCCEKTNPNSLLTPEMQLEAIKPIKHEKIEKDVLLSDSSEKQKQNFASKSGRKGKLNLVSSSPIKRNDATTNSNDSDVTILYEDCTKQKRISHITLDSSCSSEFNPGSDDLSTSYDSPPITQNKRKKQNRKIKASKVQMKEVKYTKPKDNHPDRVTPNSSDSNEEKDWSKSPVEKEHLKSYTSHSSDSCILLSSKIKNYTNKDDIAIVKYIYKNGALKWVKGRAIWQEMQEKDIISGRSWHSLKERFLKRILPRIESYENLPLSVVTKLTKLNQQKKTLNSGGSNSQPYGKYYTMKEDLELLDYITQNKRVREIKGKAMWVSMAKALSNSRSWESLKNRFLKNIYPNLHLYKISKESKNEFRNFLQGGEKSKLEEPIALKKGVSSSYSVSATVDSSSHNQTNREKTLKDLPKERTRSYSSDMVVQFPLQISPNDFTETSSSDEDTKIDRNQSSPIRHKLYSFDDSKLYKKRPVVNDQQGNIKEKPTPPCKVVKNSQSNHEKSKSLMSISTNPALYNTPLNTRSQRKNGNLFEKDLVSSQEIENSQTTKIFSDYEGEEETSDTNSSDSPIRDTISLPSMIPIPQNTNIKAPQEILISGTTFKRTSQPRRLCTNLSPRTSQPPTTMLNTKRKRRKIHQY